MWVRQQTCSKSWGLSAHFTANIGRNVYATSYCDRLWHCFGQNKPPNWAVSKKLFFERAAICLVTARVKTKLVMKRASQGPSTTLCKNIKKSWGHNEKVMFFTHNFVTWIFQHDIFQFVHPSVESPCHALCRKGLILHIYNFTFLPCNGLISHRWLDFQHRAWN